MHENTRRDSFGCRTPFYMTYPFSDHLYAEEENERDMEALIGLCPGKARQLWPYVSDACDRMEYDGSLMYDEYPDRCRVRRQVRQIRNWAEEGGQQEGRDTEELIELLLYQEMYRRRCRRRRFQQHFIY